MEYLLGGCLRQRCQRVAVALLAFVLVHTSASAAQPAPEPPVTGAAPTPRPTAPASRPTSPAAPTTPAPAPTAASSEPRAEVLAPAELNVRDQSEQANIFVDDELVGTGTFQGKVAPGRHRLRVVRPGYQTLETVIDVRPGQVHTESVALRPAVSAEVASTTFAPTADADGLYGGVALLAAFQPNGSGTTLADACDTTGATHCTAGSVKGGGLSGYIGWMFTPLGLELALLVSGDVVEPVASFDGVTGSDINPNLAAPARDEQFTIARAGGGVTLRARFEYSLSKFRFSAAAGPGLAYRYLVLSRKTESALGYSGEVADSGSSYVSPMLSVELAAQWRFSRTAALALGVATWFEHAGDGVKSEARDNAVLLGADGASPLPQATPEYDMANGTQWYIGPFVGLGFGP
jgi:hypothetical protein